MHPFRFFEGRVWLLQWLLLKVCGKKKGTKTKQIYTAFSVFLKNGPSFLHADSEDSDQIGWIPRLTWVFAGRTVSHFVGFVMRRLICCCTHISQRNRYGLKIDFSLILEGDQSVMIFNSNCIIFKVSTITRGQVVLYRSPECWGYFKISGYWGKHV